MPKKKQIPEVVRGVWLIRPRSPFAWVERALDTKWGLLTMLGMMIMVGVVFIVEMF